MLLKGLKLAGERFARVIEVFEDGFQALGRDGFHAYQRSFDVGTAHSIQEFAVSASFHGDLGEGHHVLRQLRKFFHQMEAVGVWR